MNLTVNGESRLWAVETMTVTTLLGELGLKDRRVAVEVDRRIVTRANHESHVLSEGNVVEIVHFVGGG
jgi:sulfur carrier protein